MNWFLQQVFCYEIFVLDYMFLMFLDYMFLYLLWCKKSQFLLYIFSKRFS